MHQGDGNAAILGGDPRVFTLSIQGAKNFPFRRVPSSLDIELPDGTEDRAYLAAVADAQRGRRSRSAPTWCFISPAPIHCRRIPSAGSSLTHEGLAERDRFVFETFRRRGVPVSIAIGGGYARPIEATVEAYANTFRVAREVHGWD